MDCKREPQDDHPLRHEISDALARTLTHGLATAQIVAHEGWVVTVLGMCGAFCCWPGRYHQYQEAVFANQDGSVELIRRIGEDAVSVKIRPSPTTPAPGSLPAILSAFGIVLNESHERCIDIETRELTNALYLGGTGFGRKVYVPKIIDLRTSTFPPALR
jgi:hypothetical protein